MSISFAEATSPFGAAAHLSAASGSERIRVLHSVGHLDRGGIENWVFQMIRHMDRSRFDHHVLVRTDQEEPFTAQFRAAGIPVLACTGVESPLKFARNFLRVLHKHGPYDVLHAHGFSSLTTQTLMLAKTAGVPLRILHSHDDLRPTLEQASAAYRVYAAVSLSVIRFFANAGLACGKQAAEWVFGGDWNHHALQPELMIGIDMDPCFQAPDPSMRRRLGIPEDVPVLLQVGRFEVQKNHAFMVKVAQCLRMRQVPFHLVLVGTGSLRQEIQDRMRDRGLEKHVTWIPASNELPLLMRSVADLALLPSLHEGLPLVHLESQAARLPMLISDHVTQEAAIDASLLEFLPIDHGPQIWADRIVARLQRPIDRTIDAMHRERFLQSRFNIGRCVEELSDIYLHARRPSRHKHQEMQA